MYGPSIRSCTVLALLWLISLTTAAEPQQLDRREFDLYVAKQGVTDALHALSQQTGLNYGYLPDSAAQEQVLVGPIRGRFTLSRALTKLLSPAGFGFIVVDARTVRIVSPDAMPPKRQSRSRRRTSSTIASRNGEQDEQGIIESVLVTDSRPWSLAIDAPSMSILDRERINQLGVSTIPEALAYVPQRPYRPLMGPAGAEYAELRGLGADTTLVLINGRRTQFTASSLHAKAFDLNTLPLTAVERLEVVLDAPTVAAGTDAIGGIVNIELKRSIDQPHVEARYGTAAGGAEERRLSASIGGDLANALQASASIDYFSRAPLLGNERERWRNQDFRRYGGDDFRMPYASRANIYGAGDNLPGLPSSIATVPAGSSGIGLTSTDFLATAGQETWESLARFFSIIPRTERLSLVGNADLHINERMSLFTELLVADRMIDLQFAPLAMRIGVPASNAFNPFDVAVAANVLLGAPQHEITRSQWLRGVFGVHGRVLDWDWDLVCIRTSDSEKTSFISYELNTVEGYRALSESDPALALNLFRDQSRTRDAVLESFADRRISEYGTNGTDVQATLRGNLANLPAGAVRSLLGLGMRRERASFDDLTSFEVRRRVSNAFLEIRAPLIDEVDLTVGVRRDDYGDIGASINSQVGVRWQPIRELAFIASSGTAFRIPSLVELFEPSRSFRTGMHDPNRGNQLSFYTMVIGGNPRLKPARSRSWSAGLTWEGATAAREVSARYWTVAMDSRIASLYSSLLLSHEDTFTDRIRRAPPGDDDLAPGFPGPLEFMDFSQINVGGLEASGVDVSATGKLDMHSGQWMYQVSTTWMSKYDETEFHGLPLVRRVGVARVLGTIPRWRATGSLAWKGNLIDVSGTARFVSSYQDHGGSTDLRVPAVPSQWTLDAQVVLHFDGWLRGYSRWEGTRITLGAINLLDEAPHFSRVGGALGFDATQGDLLGRFGYLRISKEF
jgi:iron complex outermembrane recepter protein